MGIAVKSVCAFLLSLNISYIIRFTDLQKYKIFACLLIQSGIVMRGRAM